ncbi:DUF72 domain-containing protein [Microvirga sesbaniae]|uniref:DUF72 domain-containing protein n=1 Tax=Microvirga sesbaniae TaxID=681392 RepID=UPI0021C66D72|nr:DUF72 domain-containing protein [Microvirga sp. HBU67692]
MVNVDCSGIADGCCDVVVLCKSTLKKAAPYSPARADDQNLHRSPSLPHPSAGTPGGRTGLVYYRLRGAPKMYYSAYSQDSIAEAAATLKDHAKAGRAAWCIFDNTAAFAATGNALNTLRILQS